MNVGSGLLSLENFKMALSNAQRQPKMECIKGQITTLATVFEHCICFFIYYSFSPKGEHHVLKAHSTCLSRLLHTRTLPSGMHEKVGNEGTELVQLQFCNER